MTPSQALLHLLNIPNSLRLLYMLLHPDVVIAIDSSGMIETALWWFAMVDVQIVVWANPILQLETQGLWEVLVPLASAREPVSLDQSYLLVDGPVETVELLAGETQATAVDAIEDLEDLDDELGWERVDEVLVLDF